MVKTLLPPQYNTERGRLGLITETVQSHVTAAPRHGAELAHKALVANCVRETRHSRGAVTHSAAQVSPFELVKWLLFLILRR